MRDIAAVLQRSMQYRNMEIVSVFWFSPFASRRAHICVAVAGICKPYSLCGTAYVLERATEGMGPSATRPKVYCRRCQQIAEGKIGRPSPDTGSEDP